MGSKYNPEHFCAGVVVITEITIGENDVFLHKRNNKPRRIVRIELITDTD